MLTTLLAILAAIALAFVVTLYVKHWQTQHSAQAAIFRKGKVRSQLPDGLFSGTVAGQQIVWQGKKFDAKNKTGINVFDKLGKTVERYPFLLSTGTGLADPIDVIRIDYNIPENPIWLRMVLDEIVEVEPGHYLGKLHFKVLPGLSFALGYFELRQPATKE
jgi:hypothetical protein